MPAYEPLATRLWRRVNKPATGCWVWTGYCNKKGYGVIGVHANKIDLVHRVVWRLQHGDIPEGAKVLHKCDNPPCVRHLFLGTQLDNIKDMVNKGRARGPKSETVHTARLTWNDVQCIRQQSIVHGSIARLARHYNVSRHAIWCVINNKTWKVK
jgi:hypothetical protein